MSRPGGAFSGVKLTEQTEVATPRVDQRLFSASPSTPTSSPLSNEPNKLRETSKEGNQEIGKEGSRETSQETSLPGKKEEGLSLDLNETPHRKDSFLFTESEFEALEDLKLALRRRHDLPATKNDITRLALHHIAEDYHRNPDRSIIVSRLKRKRDK